MPVIGLTGISFDYGRVPILKDASLSLEPGERAAIVGRNGVGKSTLFSVITGALRPDDGSVEKARRLRLAHLLQDRALSGDRTLFAAVRAECREIIEVEAKLAHALTRLGELPPDGPEHDKATLRHGELQHEFESLGGYELDQRVAETLTGLGFAAEAVERPVGQLSGGEQRVAALAAVLLQKPDLLLLDEPTNHLDLDAILWLEEHLLQEKAAVLMVSHDRSFLNRLCTVTFHLRDAKLSRYSGNYDFFEMQRGERDRHEMVAYERQREEIARQEDYIRRNIVGQKTKQAQSRRKRLEKMERLERPTNERTLRVRLSPARRGGNTVLVAEGIAKAFGPKRLFDRVDLHISKGEKIGLVGPNGAGKTTLLRLLMGKLPPDAGGVNIGKDIDMGFFDQHLDLVSDGHSVAEEFRTVDPVMSDSELRGQLARFGFFSDDLDKLVGQLSGGERNRLSLLKLVYQRHNFLILDEPTNHLDIAATESLEQALLAYEGTLLITSHDRSFLRSLVDRVIEVGGGKALDYPGRWDEFMEHKRALARAASGGSERKKSGGEVAAAAGGAKADEKAAESVERWSKNQLAKKKRMLAELEERIADAMREKAKLEETLAESHSLGREEILKATSRHADLVETVERREARWAALGESIEKQEALRE